MSRPIRNFGRFVNNDTPPTVKFGKVMAVVGLLIVFVPFFILVFWNLLHNWGWWRLRRERGTREYVKTWHGWVERGKYERRLRHRRNRSIFGGKATSAHIVRISWTPDGARTQQILQRGPEISLRRLLEWLGLRKLKNHRVGTSTDIELGVIPEPPTIRITEASAANTLRSRERPRPISIEQVDGPSDFGSTTTSRVISGALRNSSDAVDNGDTVRRRRSSAEHSTVWQANSSETSRATVTQFIMPSHDIRTPIWADRLFGIGGSWPTTTPLSSRKPSSSQQPEVQFLESANTYATNARYQSTKPARRVVRSSPAFSPPLTMASTAGFRSSTQLSAAIDLDNLSNYLESGSRYGRYGPFTSGRALPVQEIRPLAQSPIVRSQSLTRRLRARARPGISGFFPNIRRRHSKDSKLDGPTKDIEAAKETVPSTGENLQNYGNEESLDGIMSYHEDIEPSMFSLAPMTDGRGLRDISNALRASSQTSFETFGTACDGHKPLTSMTNRLTSKKPHFSSLATRKCVLPIRANEQEDPSTPQLLPRKLTVKSFDIPSLSLAESPNTSCQQALLPSLSLAEKARREQLRQRLQWLDLSCTVRNQHSLILDVLDENNPAASISKSGREMFKARRGLRRVGHFGLDGQGVDRGKENVNTHARDSSHGRHDYKASCTRLEKSGSRLSVQQERGGDCHRSMYF